MSYNNFKQVYWSKYIQGELEAQCVLAESCDYSFEGEIAHGEKLKILGLGRPTISTYTGGDIGSPESVVDSSVTLAIDQARYFNFKLGDIDKIQSTPGVMEALTREGCAALAEERDKFVAGLYADAGSTSSSTSVTTADHAKAALDAAFTYLWNNNVRASDEVSIIVTPWFYTLIKDKLTELYTDNVELINQGALSVYNGGKIKLSNNLHNDGTDDYMIVKTKRAVAFAGVISSTEAYRPQGDFADALKGLDVFGAKVVRPKEMYVLKAHNS